MQLAFFSHINPVRLSVIAEDFALMYLTGISTRTLALLSKRLIGRKISPEEVSKANRELTTAVEQ